MAALVRFCLVAGILFGAGVALAQPTDEQLAQDDRIAELERTVKVLADELERIAHRRSQVNGGRAA